MFVSLCVFPQEPLEGPRVSQNIVSNSKKTTHLPPGRYIYTYVYVRMYVCGFVFTINTLCVLSRSFTLLALQSCVCVCVCVCVGKSNVYNHVH